MREGPQWTARPACRAPRRRTRALCLRAGAPDARQLPKASGFTQFPFLSTIVGHQHGFDSWVHLPEAGKKTRGLDKEGPPIKVGESSVLHLL